MSTELDYPHLTRDADGTVRIDDTRWKVLHLAAEHHHLGWTAEELLRQHPDLRPEQVYAALVWFYDHHEEAVARLEESAAAAEISGTTRTLSRAELLRRRPSTGA